MEMKNGIKLLVEVVEMKVVPLNRPLMVDLLLQEGQNLSGMVVMMSG